MNEENNGTPKNKWSRIFRKKWFFPAVYLTVAALLLSVVVWYQNLENQIPGAQDDQKTENYDPIENERDAQSVIEQQEIIKMPVENQDKAEIVTNFYDYNADQEDKESALILYNDRFYQSTGINIKANDGEPFDVLASLSGTVAKVEKDPLLGNVVKLKHENGVTTHYASLGEVNVKEGDKVDQGDVLGTAGENRFGQEAGNHVHFELRKKGNELNPEKFFNQPVSSLQDVLSEEKNKEKSSEDSDSKEKSDGTKEEKTDDVEKDSTDEPGNMVDPKQDDSTGTDDTQDPMQEDSNGTDDSQDSMQEDSNGTDDSQDSMQKDSNKNAEDENSTDNTTDSSSTSESA